MKKSSKLGQHFLVNSLLAKKIVDTFLPVSHPILEIGPGRGVLTHYLLTDSPGGRITAIEIDSSLCRDLEIRFPDRLRLLCSDIRDIDLENLFSGQSIAVISNVPYYLSKEFMDWLIVQYKFIGKATLLVQREFAEKLLLDKHPKRVTPQAIVLRYLFSINHHFQVQPGSFSPPPKVVSTLLSLWKKTESAPEPLMDFYEFTKLCFCNRRKTLFNNLKQKKTGGQLEGWFRHLRIPVSVRAEDLHWSAFFPLFQFYSGKKRFRSSGKKSEK